MARFPATYFFPQRSFSCGVSERAGFFGLHFTTVFLCMSGSSFRLYYFQFMDFYYPYIVFLHSHYSKHIVNMFGSAISVQPKCIKINLLEHVCCVVELK